MLLLKRGIVYVSIGLKSTKAIPVTFLQISNMKTINIDNKSWLIMSPPTLVGRHIVFVLSVCPSQFVSATPLKLQNRISWNLVGSKDTICSCAYYQETLITWNLWELCLFELRNLLLKQLLSATPLKLLNRISWNLVGSKDTICGCAYCQEILISWILWELCPFELKNLPKYTTIK